MLMVAFALLQRRHFPPSPVGLIQPPSPDPTPTEEQAYVEQPEAASPRTPSSQDHAGAEKELDGNVYAVPPSPGQADHLTLSLNADVEGGRTWKKERRSAGKQRFWQRPSLTRGSSNSIGITRSSKERHATQKSVGTTSLPSWDRCAIGLQE